MFPKPFSLGMHALYRILQGTSGQRYGNRLKAEETRQFLEFGRSKSGEAFHSPSVSFPCLDCQANRRSGEAKPAQVPSDAKHDRQAGQDISHRVSFTSRGVLFHRALL